MMIALITELSGPHFVMFLLTLAILLRRFIPVSVVVTIEEEGSPSCFGVVRRSQRRVIFPGQVTRPFALGSPSP